MSERYSLRCEPYAVPNTESPIEQLAGVQIQSQRIGKRRSRFDAISISDACKEELPTLSIYASSEAPSPIDELRKYIRNNDHIKPFSSVLGHLPITFTIYDQDRDNYWKRVEAQIESRKHPMCINPRTRADHDDGFQYKLNPNTGKIELRRETCTLEYRPDRDGYNDGRPQYEIDPNTGAIVQQRKIHTLEWREHRDGWMRKNHHYGLNPETGRIELIPNIQLMDFRSRS